MGVILLLVMIGVPILEIAIFMEVGGRVGLWPTLGAIVLTAIVGSALLRHQGISTLFRVRENLERGEFPVSEVFDGLCLVLAGALLLTPGFVTDAVGLLLFVPALRALARHNLGRYLRASGRVEIWPGGPGPHASGVHGRGSDIIDGEYHEVPTDTDPHEDDGKNRDRRQPPGTLPEP